MNQLVIVGCAVGVFFLVAYVAALGCAAAGDRLSGRPARSPSLRAALALAPVTLGAAVALSLFDLARLDSACHCLAHLHHAHLCLTHGTFSWSLAALCMGAVLPFVATGRALARLLRAAARTAAIARPAAREREALVDGVRVGLSDALGHRAITVGALAPRIVVGAALWEALDPEARRAIALHEHAHARRRDPLTLLCLRAAACALPDALGERLVLGWRRTAELACDDLAANALGDPCAMAAALVAGARAEIDPHAPPDLAPALLGSGVGDDLEERVAALLAPGPAAPARAASDLGPTALLLSAGTIAFLALLGDATHHAAETLLGWIT